MKRLFKVVLLGLVALLLVSMPVLAAAAYRAAYTIVESDGTPYDMLAVSELVDNEWMADNGFMELDALDTLIETLGGLEKPHMVATNKTLTSVAVPANSQINLYFTTANSDSAMDIIEGYGGKITVADDASLRLVDEFEIEIDDAYINTDFVGTKNIVYKQDAFRIYISAAESVSAVIPGSGGPYNPDAHPEGSSVDGYVKLTDLAGQTWDAIQGATDGTAIDDSSLTTSVTMRCDGDVNEWDNFLRSFVLFDTSPLPDGAVIASATLQIKGTSKTDTKPWNDLTLNVFSSNPASDVALENADYDQVGTTAFATPITYAAFDIAGWNTFTLNASGLAAISTTDITKFSIREATYDAPDSEPAWADGKLADFTFNTGDSAGNEPILTVVYSVSVTATGIESGQHDIRVAADGTDFEISIDSAVAPAAGYNTTPLGGVTVFGNTEDWLIMDNSTTDFMPYMGFYKHTTAIGGSSLKAWYQPNAIIANTRTDGTAEAGSDADTIIDDALDEGDDYWIGALVTITGAGAAAPEGETSICTAFADATNEVTVTPAFSAAVENGDTFTIEFGTLIDRSYYGVEFDAVDDIIACGAAADMDITDEATLTAWVYIDSEGENSEGSIIDRRDATPDGYRFYVSSEAAGDVAIEAILDGATDAYAVSNVEVAISGWHYIVAVYNRLGTFHWEIYEDGVLLGLTTDQAGVAPITGHTANVMNIGDNAASDRCFDGKIDEPSFYTTAWTQALVTANYNAGAGLYTPTDTTSIALQLHMEEGSGAAVADTSGEANNGTITNALWVNGKVPRPAGNAGTNDSRLTWGANPTGIAVTLGGMVSEGQPTPGALPSDPAQDILPETGVTDWYIEPDVEGTLLTNPLRPFVTMWSDNSTLTELQCWRIYALALILLITVATAMAVGHHQGITMIAAGVAILGAGVLTIFPMWALAFAIGMFIGGLVMERSPSL